MFDTITGQTEPLSRLMTMKKNGAVPHALLFTGIDGIGKSLAAVSFARVLNCKSDEPESVPCRQCRSCKKILAGTHPDILTIQPSGSIIKIAQIRDLCQKLLIKPVEAAVRVVIIQDAHTMNPESGNALLKVLEEPPDRTMFILITDQASDVLPTILSRCQMVGFNPLSRESIKELLIQKGVDVHRAEGASAMALGSLGRALSLCENKPNRPDPLVFRRFLFDEMVCLIRGGTFDVLSFAEKLSQKKDNTLNALDILLSFIRDLIVHPFDRDKVINRDMAQEIGHLSASLATSSLLRMADLITAAHQGIKANASVRLCLETMAIQIKRI